MKMKKQIYFPLLLTLLASLVFGVFPLRQGVAYASPDEYLLNPSFTGGITDWTPDTTYYAPSEFQDSPGSIKTMTLNKKNDAKTGTCSQTISTAIGSLDTVTLSLWYKKGYTADALAQDLKAQIALPSDPSAFIDIWSETTISNLDTWTEVPAFDVSAHFTETGTYQFRFHMFLDNPNAVTEVWANIDNAHLDVTPAPPSISNAPSSYPFGTVTAGSTPNTTTGWFIITNSSNVTIDINIKCDGWSFTAGSNNWIYGASAPDTARLKASNDQGGVGGSIGAGQYDIIVPSGETGTLFCDDVATGTTTINWELQLEAPSGFTHNDPQITTVTLTATQA